MSKIWFNGEVFDEDDPIYKINDRIRLGECVFATILVVDGKPQFWDAHIEKLESHLKVMGLSLECDSHELLQHTQNLLQQNNAQTGQTSLNIFVTGGPSGAGIKTPENPEFQTSMRTASIPNEWPLIHAIIAQNVRRNEGSPLSQIKCSNYGESILAAQEAKEKGANDAILLNNAEHASCSTVATIAVEKDGALFTPPLADGAQSGVTRKRLIQDMSAIEKSMTPEDLLDSDGVYLCNSLRGCQPVLSLDGKTLPVPTLIPKDFHLE